MKTLFLSYLALISLFVLLGSTQDVEPAETSERQDDKDLISEILRSVTELLRRRAGEDATLTSNETGQPIIIILNGSQPNITMAEENEENVTSEGEMEEESNETQPEEESGVEGEVSEEGESNETNIEDVVASNVTDVMGLPVCSIVDRTETTVELDTATFDTLRKGNGEFALDLYKNLRESISGNFLFSPYSIARSIGMVYAGASETTSDNIANALRFEVDKEFLHEALYQVNEKLNSEDNRLDFNITMVNSFWAKQGPTYLDEFKHILNDYYRTCLGEGDFLNNLEAIRLLINQWVLNETNGTIQDNIKGGELTDSTSLLLVNAILFKSHWDRPFSADQSAEDTFNLLDGSTVQALMMKKTDDYYYYEGDNYKAIDLLYRGRNFGLTIILPNEGMFNDVADVLSYEFLEDIRNNLFAQTIELSLPKFSFSSGWVLADQLKRLGMEDAFTSGDADFSGIDGDRDLYLSQVFHHAMVTVDEDGTQLAETTEESAPTEEEFLPTELKVDRPFIFHIHDIDGNILFWGHVMNPIAV